MSDLAAFLERHPWPEEMLALGKPLDCLWHFELDASADELWPWVSDTSRMNRAMGVTGMEFSEKDGVLHGSSRNAGVLQEWVEVPWVWVAERALVSIRRYSRGFAHIARGIYEIEPLGERRVRYSVYFGWIPRGLWQRALLRIAMNQLHESYKGVLARIEASLREKSKGSPYRISAPPLPADAEARLLALTPRLAQSGVSAELIERLTDLVRRGDEMDLHRIQLLPLARRWRAREDELLHLFLSATRAGILSLSWDVICPHCRGVREEARTLGEVPPKGECAVCNIDFETASDNAIEITFHVHPSIREVPKLWFCSAEPATKPHIKLQQRLSPKSHAELATLLRPGRYRARIREDGLGRHALIDVLEGEGARQLAWNSERPLERAVAGPDPVLLLENPVDRAATFVIEDALWSDDALRPARLFSFQEFRDLFTEEYLGADVQLSVGRQTILFTDVVGSTKLYASRGDPGAFMDVKRHFTEIYEEVKQHGGAIVKTIGDAAMAAFVDPVRALRAARAIHAHFPPGREDLALRVRISLNTGPCIAVKLNTNIDYFGNTVNVAAKLQTIAGAGQIAFTEEVLAQPGVKEYLEVEGAKVERVVLDSASLAAPVAAVRWG
jgi:class 3 adenylate cyclase